MNTVKHEYSIPLHASGLSCLDESGFNRAWLQSFRLEKQQGFWGQIFWEWNSFFGMDYLFTYPLLVDRQLCHSINNLEEDDIQNVKQSTLSRAVRFHSSQGGGQRGPDPLIYGTTYRSVFSTNAQSRFASAVVDRATIGLLRHANNTCRCPCLFMTGSNVGIEVKSPWRMPCQLKKPLKGQKLRSCWEEWKIKVLS